MSQAANPCSDCGTTEGYTQPGRSRPMRADGTPYGFAGPLCMLCRKRHYRRARAVANGTRRVFARPVARSLHFPVYEPTRTEILGQARVLQFGTPWMARHLVILTPGFTVADLTGRAQVRVLIAETKKQRRRSA